MVSKETLTLLNEEQEHQLGEDFTDKWSFFGEEVLGHAITDIRQGLYGRQVLKEKIRLEKNETGAIVVSPELVRERKKKKTGKGIARYLGLVKSLNNIVSFRGLVADELLGKEMTVGELLNIIEDSIRLKVEHKNE